MATTRGPAESGLTCGCDSSGYDLQTTARANHDRKAHLLNNRHGA
jgi:hypothetical protein